MKFVQINTSANTGSHGRIAEDIGELLIEKGHQSIIAFGRSAYKSKSDLVRIGTWIDHDLHLFRTRIFDRHGFGSSRATNKLIKYIDKTNPVLIHLHNVHGYYLNIKVLFEYLKSRNIAVIWTFHDCWPFTGHCSYFDAVSCLRWQTECHDCPNLRGYPQSWFIDNSRKNFIDKKHLFTGLKNVVLVSPSEWLAGHLKKSFLNDYEIKVINNGINIEKFKPTVNRRILEKHKIDRKYILGVASVWSNRKGLKDFMEIRKKIDPEIEIVLVGLSYTQMRSLPIGVRGISRTESINELATLYTGAEIFVNPTYVDNFPTTNIEALACGTPVITYNTGGSPEVIDRKTGIVIDKGDLIGLSVAIKKVLLQSKSDFFEECRQRAVRLYNKNDRYEQYLTIYKSLIGIQ